MTALDKYGFPLINTTNFMQVVEQTNEEQLVMYMRCKKKELVKMLIQCHKFIDYYITTTPYNGDMPFDMIGKND